MANAAYLNIILVEDAMPKTPNKAGEFVPYKKARCIVLNDDGSVSTVGWFRPSKELEPSVQVGYFSAAFAFGVRDYGDNAGRIEPIFTALTPIDPKMLRPAGKPAAA